MITETKWRFPKNDYGESKGINDSGISTFRGNPSSLAREICQNSLDASLEQEPVLIEFSKFSLKTKLIPGNEDLRQAFTKCRDSSSDKKTISFFKKALTLILSPEIECLRISDFYTTGLKGTKLKKDSDWINLIKYSGASNKSEGAGGSFGIGKYATFSCSDLSTVFYSTNNIDKEQAYQGVSRIVSYYDEKSGQDTQGIAYYGNDKNTPIYEQLILDKHFIRKQNQYGTDIFILGYQSSPKCDWKVALLSSILENFICAIWNDKLKVKVGDILVSKSNLDSVIEKYKNELNEQTLNYYAILTSKETIWYEEDFLELGKIKLGILQGTFNAQNKVCMVRRNGMKIFDKKFSYGNISFSGLLLINGEKINNRLRLIENPEHTQWNPNRSEYPNKDKQLVGTIFSFISKKIESLIDTSAEGRVDAAGVSQFIPDEDDPSQVEKSNVDLESKILSIEIEKVPLKSLSNKLESNNNNVNYGKETEEGDLNTSGDDPIWKHNDGQKINDREIPNPQSINNDVSKQNRPKLVGVIFERFMCLCANKSKGQYILSFLPRDNYKNATLKLFISAETNNYDAPIKSATDIQTKQALQVKGNSIFGLNLNKDKEFRASLELDYYDYCSIEVSLYEIKK